MPIGLAAVAIASIASSLLTGLNSSRNARRLEAERKRALRQSNIDRFAAFTQGRKRASQAVKAAENIRRGSNNDTLRLAGISTDRPSITPGTAKSSIIAQSTLNPQQAQRGVRRDTAKASAIRREDIRRSGGRNSRTLDTGQAASSQELKARNPAGKLNTVNDPSAGKPIAPNSLSRIKTGPKKRKRNPVARFLGI